MFVGVLWCHHVVKFLLAKEEVNARTLFNVHKRIVHVGGNVLSLFEVLVCLLQRFFLSALI